MPRTQRQPIQTIGSLLHATGLGCALLAAVVFYGAIYAPRANAIDRLNEEIAGVQLRLHGANTIRQQYSQLIAQRKQQRQLAEEVRQRVPDAPQEAEFLEVISKGTPPEDFVITDYSRGQAIQADGCRQVDIQLQCNGTYAGICRFLDQLDNMPRITHVVGLELKSQMVEQRYPLTITVRLYFGVQPVGLEKGKRLAGNGRAEVHHG